MNTTNSTSSAATPSRQPWPPIQWGKRRRRLATNTPGSGWRQPALVLPVLLSLWAACQPRWTQTPHDALHQSEPPPKLHAQPQPIEATDWVPTFWYSSFGQIGRELSPGIQLERYSGGPPALDVNAFGKVPDSLWFENRIGRQRMTLQQIQRGPNRDHGPSTARLMVQRGTTGGVTPGFVVTDARGQNWIVKFDHPAFPELTSGAEVVSTKILYAAGYHVPENYVVTVNVKAFELVNGATTTDDYNRTVPFSKVLLQQELDQLNPSPRGYLRAVFSKQLPGTPLGPYPVKGTRPDDPNDTILHERRRSLRGLWVFYAWLNNTDAKYSNTLDMFIEARPGLGYVKHYLIDFGTSLGATPQGPKPRKEGFEHTVDWSSIGRRAAHLGISYPYWATVRRNPLRAVGSFEADAFDPARWHPVHVNPTFEASDPHDTFWAASILAHMGPLEIAAAASTGEYPEHGAVEFITRTLLERRNKILRYAFAGFTPLDDPKLSQKGQLSLVDLEVLAGLTEQRQLEYRWSLSWHRDQQAPMDLSAQTVHLPHVALEPTLRWFETEHPNAVAKHPFFTVSLTRRELGAAHWGPRVFVRLRRLPGHRTLLVGLERQRR